MIFEYQAIDSKGKKTSDIIDAPNVSKAREKLRSQGLFATKITANTSGIVSSISGEKKGIFSRFSDMMSNRSSSKQVGLFSRQLSTLVGAGMPLLRAVSDILEQTDHAGFKHIIADIKQKLEEGMSLSNSLAKHPAVFSEMYINMVRVGENLGSLDTVIERLADIEEKNSILKRKIQAAMMYPGFLISFAMIVIIFLMIKVIPLISERFADQGRELPLPTQIIMGISSFLSSYWIILLLFILVSFYLLKRHFATPAGREKLHERLLTMPLISRLYKKQIILKFTQNLGILLKSNVDIIKSFEIVKKIVGNVIIERKIDEASKKIREGMPVSKALAKSDFLPKLVIGMISAGEASDTLDDMLVRIGTVYENEFDLTISSLTSILEPLIIVFMGGVIGLIVISVMLPIMEMNLMVQ
jgi:type II secretory pathway component PulF